MKNLKITKVVAKEVTTRQAKNTYTCHLYITYFLNNNTEIQYVYKTYDFPKINIPRKTSVGRGSSLKEFLENRDKWDFCKSTFPQKISVTGALERFVKAHVPKLIKDIESYLSYSDDYDTDIVDPLIELAVEKYGVFLEDKFIDKFIINTERYTNLRTTLEKKAKERLEYIEVVDALIHNELKKVK